MLAIDTKVAGPKGTYSYGPRRSEGGQVLPPYGDMPAQFWSVYHEDAEGYSQWVVDYPTESEARDIARLMAGIRDQGCSGEARARYLGRLDRPMTADEWKEFGALVRAGH